MKIKVVKVEAGKLARIDEIDNKLEPMQEYVGGYIEPFCPFEDEVAIICNEEGKINGMTLNRAVYANTTNVSYEELRSTFCDCEKRGQHTRGRIVFSEDSFDKPYSLEARTYEVSSDNKAFQPRKGGYSIYGSSIDGQDVMVRLENYMADEKGGPNGWKIDYCELDTPNKMVEIIAGNFFVCGARAENTEFTSLTDEEAEIYCEMFKYPEAFFRVGGGIVAKKIQVKE